MTKLKAKDTLTPIELNKGEKIQFLRANGKSVEILLVNTRIDNLEQPEQKSLNKAEIGVGTIINFSCDVKINGKKYTLKREIGTQKSFYEPWEIEGLTIWFDAIREIFEEILTENHGSLYPVPEKQARFAIQDIDLEICPEKLHPWCPLPAGGLRIEDCYRGEDCWLGPYDGVEAHGGLDINHNEGTPLWAPLEIDDHYYFNSVELGDNNNRWRGFHKWDNGSEWILQAHHMTELTVSEHKPLKKGEQFARAAGVWVGAHEHSHFVFKIRERGKTYILDPWILFWKMYRDLEVGEK